MGFYVRNNTKKADSAIVYVPTMKDQRDLCTIVAYKLKALEQNLDDKIDCIVSIGNGGDGPARYIEKMGGFDVDARTIRISSYYRDEDGMTEKKGVLREMFTDLEPGKEYKSMVFVDDMFDSAGTWIWLRDYAHKMGYIGDNTEILTAVLWVKKQAEAAPDAFGEIIGNGWINLPRESPEDEKAMRKRIVGYEPPENVVNRQWKAYLAEQGLQELNAPPERIAGMLD